MRSVSQCINLCSILLSKTSLVSFSYVLSDSTLLPLSMKPIPSSKLPKHKLIITLIQSILLCTFFPEKEKSISSSKELKVHFYNSSKNLTKFSLMHSFNTLRDYKQKQPFGDTGKISQNP